jgi:hypothetical protein
MIGILIFAIVVFVLVYVGCIIVDKTLPAEVQMPAKVVIGLIGLLAILYKLAPMAGLT